MRPITTLFMLMSLDGKISTGDSDEFDFDRDLPKVSGVREGLHQYYDIERTTDLWSFNTGRVMAKIGVCNKPIPFPLGVSFVIKDDYHLTETGIRNLAGFLKQLVIITTNANHPVCTMCKLDNVTFILQDTLNLSTAFDLLYAKFGCESITIQSGGSMNSLLFREGLVDYINIVIAPLIVGGADVSTLVDGESIKNLDDLVPLRLVECKPLSNFYVQMKYKVVK